MQRTTSLRLAPGAIRPVKVGEGSSAESNKLMFVIPHRGFTPAKNSETKPKKSDK